MRAVIQRVTRAAVRIDSRLHSSIGRGMVILLGVRIGDEEGDAISFADRCASLRIFNDADGKMNLSVLDIGGQVMVVSQFTLYGDTRRGNRPSFTEAAPPDVAERLYDVFLDRLGNILGPDRVASGIFRSMMDVELVNDGPVTVMLEGKPRGEGAGSA